MKELEIINYANCISASRPDRIIPGTLWIGRSNDKHGLYMTTQLLNGVGRVYIKSEGSPEIIYGNCIAASRPDRITPGTLRTGGSNDNNGVYPTTELLPGVAGFCIKMKDLEILIMEIISQLHAPTAIPPILYG
jgi:hypothetical protein